MPAAFEKIGVVTKVGRLGRGCRRVSGEPIPTLTLVAAADAFGTSLVPRRATFLPGRLNALDTDARHHAIHQCDLTENPLKHRAAEAEVAHLKILLPR
jgi:hypothetical protein